MEENNIKTASDIIKNNADNLQQTVEQIAPNFVRIGGTWFKKCQNPDGDFTLEKYSKENIIADYGKEFGKAIVEAAGKCINTCYIPEHLNYKEYIMTQTGDKYFNLYRPLAHIPQEGCWKHIERLFRHIFGEQYELGLDYAQLIYTKPKQRLPILVLVSTENTTGKSTFCNFFKSFLGENAMALSNHSFETHFNSTWVEKLFVFVEETKNTDPKIINQFKTYATAEYIPAEGKGKDMQNKKIYFKIVLCSNDEINPTIIERTDTRHWVRKVPVIRDSDPDENFLEECRKEIPAFLYFLEKRMLYTSDHDRLWFTPKETHTSAWDKIVSSSLANVDQVEAGLRDMLVDFFAQTKKEKQRFSATNLLQLAEKSGSFSKKARYNLDKIQIKKVLTKWGLVAGKKTERFEIYDIDKHENFVVIKKDGPGKPYTIYRSLIQDYFSPSHSKLF